MIENKISRRLGITVGIVVLTAWLFMGQKYFGLPNEETLQHASSGILTFEDMQKWAVFLILMGGAIAFYYVPTKSCSDSVKSAIEALYEKKEFQLNEIEKKELSFHKFYDSMNRVGHLILKIGIVFFFIGTVFRVI